MTTQADVELAQAIATWAHRGQLDKSLSPYIDHPKAVFYRVYADDQYDFDGQIVAWLHDVVEDQRKRCDFVTIGQFFPVYIVDAVIAITFRASNQSENRDGYYERVKRNRIALRVKLHDIAHNTSPKRMDKLDKETRERLIEKYKHALERLNDHSFVA